MIIKCTVNNGTPFYIGTCFFKGSLRPYKSRIYRQTSSPSLRRTLKRPNDNVVFYRYPQGTRERVKLIKTPLLFRMYTFRKKVIQIGNIGQPPGRGPTTAHKKVLSTQKYSF